MIKDSMLLLRHTGNAGGFRIRACVGQRNAVHTAFSPLLAWLESRGETEALTSLTIGNTNQGRALLSIRHIKRGEQVLRVSRELMITPNRLPSCVEESLSEDVNEWSRLALFQLLHKHAGKASPWEPYIRCLPPLRGLQNTVFWRDEELELLRQSNVYDQTEHRKTLISNQFDLVQAVVNKYPELFGETVTLESFKHAYCVASSRSWGVEALGSITMVPFVDMFNHDSSARALLAYYEEEGYAEVVADKDYNQGSQVVITYGTLPNSSLALDFGFTLPDNPHDEVQIWMEAPSGDPLRAEKLKLLRDHGIATDPFCDGTESGGAWFGLREISSPAARGKGIPRALRTFVRVISASTTKELEAMAEDAKRRQGRLAQRPLKDGKEARALKLLLDNIEQCVSSHRSALKKVLKAQDLPQIQAERARMAGHVLDGELRVLRSVGAWLRPRAEGGGYESLGLA
ncbi:ribulose-1,5 bisphosphate carboxylase/oxygenase large subunit N-methyltransferase, chloroplastic isoform X2 [Physcomitrium patens]|uniref:SET domain-containing protein n=1 Tax=Physcomitrium patens TaxID=3218 RepID=A9T6N8_PHYPA|nr:ribulose-1,5 bisphosphate carboxylase/oxygenase large subunit N-methyltransferase, chloroplastic-like isoform X2 [Physcomitrium patens]PNR34143.1 hypothetical protein PHYPA_023960 [Physcomitrium patens]|eukprot:XP_024403343.1 ribulose-1,5 bisphosphate carboxylase/oxygenase large subunit N-methyltransferase, chloroplastic-like isoform X2 [Physcomitrella patens]